MTVAAFETNKRNATASWSGYVYQGKVGILLALKNISEQYATDPNNIETILEGWSLEYENYEDFDIKSGSEVVSRHQVKAKKTAQAHLKGEYSQALRDFDITNCPEGRRFLHTICEVTNWNSSPVLNPHSVELYRYPDDDLFCNLAGDEIQQFALSYLRILRDDASDDLLQQIYFYLNAKLLDVINESHGGNPVLSLKDIYLTVQNSPIDQLQSELSAIRLKCLLVKYLYELKDDLETNEDPLGDSWGKAAVLVDDLCRMDWEALRSFLMDIHPHNANFAKDQDFNGVGFKESFLELLRNARADFNISSMGYQHNKESYVASTINDNDRAKVRLARDIIKNPHNTKVMFEGRNIVTKNIEYDFADLTGITYDNTILSPNNIRFVKVEEAIENLNQEQQ